MRLNWLRQHLKPAWTLILALGFNSSTTTVPSQAAPDNRIGAATRIQFVLPPKGAPGKRLGTGTRDPLCPKVEKPLTALVPFTNIGLTISDRPTFWFYIPYQATSFNPVEFDLRDGNKKSIYNTTFQLKNTPGIISISLPQNVKALESGKKYRWHLSFICNPANRNQDDVVYGEVERVTLKAEVMSELEAAKTARDRISIYAQHGLWYETLTKLAQLRRTNPQDDTLKTDWDNLFETAGLNNNITTEPILREKS